MRTIDVGCAQGGWGKNAMEILQSEACKKSGKKFHIFSVTGGEECNEMVQENGHVTLYQFNQFKIETIDEEFSKRGFNFAGKVDLIVSNWTLRHLVDPFGTLKRMYSLLTPAQGILMSNGFLFKFNNSDEVQGFPRGNENILTHTNATPLFRSWNIGRDADQFLLIRDNDNALDLPLEYTGEIYEINHEYQCASGILTAYNKGFSTKPGVDLAYITSDIDIFYYNKNDLNSKKLYLYLKDQGLFNALSY